jgi:pimeloyl-ACP methyl ester carboxylesterase
MTPFRVSIPQREIDDLRARLHNARLPETATVADWSQGVPLSVIEEARRSWLDDHDWHLLEEELNAYPQWRTPIDDLDVHFIHARSNRADARPLLITHGWPGSVAEYLDILPGLVDPPAGEPAFHVVLPSLPGYGFSGRPRETGWGIERIADAWASLMTALGYARFLAQGGDWGAMITTTLALRHPERVAMMHTPVPWAIKPADFDDATLTVRERCWLEELAVFRAKGGGYAALMSTRPQTFGYGVLDSPVAQLAWILEAHQGHGERDSQGKSLVPLGRTIDNAALHWFSGCGASAARLYWESLGKMDMVTPVTVPTGVTVFPKELMKLPRAWVEARYTDLRYWDVAEQGGHYAMLEVPGSYVEQLRKAFALAPA